MIIKRLFIIIASLYFTSSLYASYRISRLGKSDGLTSSTVNCMAEDNRGFVWVGTTDGLFRFDGCRFCRYAISASDENDDMERQVNAMALSQDGKLWISTDHTVRSLNLETEQITVYDGNLKDNLVSVTKLFVDSHNLLWALSYKGITMIDISSNHAMRINGGESVVATHVVETSSGTLWFTALDGNIYRYDRHNKRIIPFRILNDDEKNDKTFLVSAVEYNNDNIAIATNNKGVRLFNPHDNSITTLFPFGDPNSNVFIHTFVCEDNERFCFGTENGLFIYGLSDGKVTHLQKSFSQPNSLSDNAIHSLLLKNGDLWVGTFFGGINVINHEPDVIKHYLPTDYDGFVCGNIIRDMVEDGAGKIWVGTEDCGLMVFDPEKPSLIKQHLTWNNGLLPDNIQGMDIAGNILVAGTFDNGIYLIDVSDNTVTYHLPKVSPQNDIAQEIVASVLFISEETCLLGTNNGLFMFNVATKQVEGVGGLNNCFVHALTTDSKGRIWIGTFNDGLFYTGQHPGNKILKKSGFPYNNISFLFESSNNILYVGTSGNGLYTYNLDTRRAELIKLTDNPDRLVICSIEETDNGHIWVSTTSGLFDYDPYKNEVITSYMRSKFLPDDHFNYSSSCCDIKGHLYFGTYGGMVVLNPNYMESGAYPLNVLVTSVEGKSFFKGHFNDNYFQTTYDKATFALYYGCPSHSLSRQIWYRYKIEGVDSDWTVKPMPTPIEFHNLAPGTYHVYIQASYWNGVWDNSPVMFTIEVSPPIWKSSVAYILYVLFVVGTLSFLFRLYRKKLNKRHQQQLKTLNEVKEKEKLQEKIKFFTNVTHEIRTPLTLMMGSIDRLAKENRNDNEHNIKRLQSNSNRLLNLVNQLLDFRKIESEQMYMNFTDIDVIPVVAQLCYDFDDLARKRNVNVSFHTTLSHCKIVGDSDSIYKIFNNILANAIKFADTYVSVSISKKTKGIQQYMIVRTDNDGATIPPSMQQDIFKPFVQHYDAMSATTIKGSGLGLHIVKSLAELHGGKFYYDTSCEKCNSFVLELPVLISDEKDGLDVEQSDDELNAAEIQQMPGEEKGNDTSGMITVMIVDDEDDLRCFVAEELAANYKVIEARNGAEALESLKTTNVSLVITDLMMPVMDGIQLCKEIRSDIRISHIPILVLTAKTSLNDHIEVLQANADAYIEKPFSTEHLKAQIANLIKNREILQNLYVHSPYSLSIGSITTNKTDDDFISKMDEFIASHIYSNRNNVDNSPLTVETLAGQMTMSTATLYRKVKSITSLSPKEYIQLCRLKEAARMLKEKNMTIKYVAEELGFSSVSHFTQCFMKQFGITPSKFMKSE